MTINTVLFDAAGTLIKPARPVGESYSLIAEKHGVRVAPADLSERFRDCFDDAGPLAFPGATPSSVAGLERDWWLRLVREIFSPFAPFADFAGYFDELFEYFARPESWQLYTDSLDALRALSARNLKLAVVSNFDSRLVRILGGLGVADFFSAIHVSSAVGYAKPDPRIFEHVLARENAAAVETLHVGDSIDNDIQGARNAGLTGLLVDRRGGAGACSATCIASLREITQHID